MFFKKKEISFRRDTSLERTIKWEKDIEKADYEFRQRVRSKK